MAWYKKLHWQIILGLLLGTLYGIGAAHWGLGGFTADWIAPFGKIFINLLKLIAMPLVLASLVCKEYLTVRQCDTPFTSTVSTWIPRFHTVGRWAAYTLSTAGIVAIVGTRLHYTLDVVIAIYITWRTWGSYHERCDPRNKKYASLIIRWLEARTVSRKTILASIPFLIP